MKIKELLDYAPTLPLMVHKDASLAQIVSLLCKHNDSRDIYVVTDSNKFLGIIPFRNVLRLVCNEFLPSLSRREIFELVVPCLAEDLMQSSIDCLSIDDNIEELVPKLLSDCLNEIPVVDSQKKLIGTIKLSTLLTFVHFNTVQRKLHKNT